MTEFGNYKPEKKRKVVEGGGLLHGRTEQKLEKLHLNICSPR
jgi:hypothetical protein